MKEEIKAGLIIIASLVMLTVMIVLIGGGRFIEKTDVYYIKVMNAAGLEVGAQVKLGGVRIGRIAGIKEPKAAGEKVLIEIAIKKGTPIYRGTRALITQIGFVGDIYLLLTVNNTQNELIRPGEVIPADETVDFAVIMAKVEVLSRSLDTLINDIRKIFNTQNIKEIESLLSNTNRAIVSSSSNIEKLTASIKGTTDKLSVVLNDIEAIIKDNRGEVSLLVKKAREDLDRAEGMIKSIEKSAKTVGRAVDIQSQNLDNLLTTMTRTTEELQEALQEIRTKPWSIIYKEEKGE